MKAKLVVAFAVLLFAFVVRADTFTIYPCGTGPGACGGVPITIPDGSTVTSTTESEPIGGIYGPAYVVSFDFADGTGTSGGNIALGFGGFLYFTTPVSDATFSWFGSPFTASDNAGDGLNVPNGGEGTETFSGPGITEIEWGSYNNPGGISSITYTLDSSDPPANAPEPSSLMLAGVGLAALIGLARRNRTNGQKAMV
jgi:hypothetical protein